MCRLPQAETIWVFKAYTSFKTIYIFCKCDVMWNKTNWNVMWYISYVNSYIAKHRRNAYNIIEYNIHTPIKNNHKVVSRITYELW